jgi:hypothetical protein
VSSLRSHHSLYEPLPLDSLCPVVAAPLTEAIREEEKENKLSKTDVSCSSIFITMKLGFLMLALNLLY